MSNLNGETLQCFLDKIIIAAHTFGEFFLFYRQFLTDFLKFNLILDLAKLQQCKFQITYLGFTLKMVIPLLNKPLIKMLRNTNAFGYGELF